MNKERNTIRPGSLIKHVANRFRNQIARQTDANTLVRSLALDLDFDRTPQKSLKHSFLFCFQIRKGLVTVFIGGAISNDAVQGALSMLGKVARHELIRRRDAMQNDRAHASGMTLEKNQCGPCSIRATNDIDLVVTQRTARIFQVI